MHWIKIGKILTKVSRGMHALDVLRHDCVDTVSTFTEMYFFRDRIVISFSIFVSTNSNKSYYLHISRRNIMVSTKVMLVSFSFLLLVFNGCERQNDLGDITGSSSNSVGAVSKASVAPGAVYTLSNSTSGNSAILYTRGADGTLLEIGSFGTGGLGTGGGLGDQGALVLSANNRWLFAVNAGSNEITVFAVTPNGLTWLNKVSSGGVRPISITVHENLLYVLNAGSGGNITVFSVGDNGNLSTLAGSTRALSDTATGPAQVAFNPNGTVLVVTEKATNRIDTYTVGTDGIASGPTPHTSAGQTRSEERRVGKECRL